MAFQISIILKNANEVRRVCLFAYSQEEHIFSINSDLFDIWIDYYSQVYSNQFINKYDHNKLLGFRKKHALTCKNLFCTKFG